MTGSIAFNRQHSSTVGYPAKEKLARPKLRRCSSVDDHSSFELTPDGSPKKKNIFSKFDPTASDSDSGIEDFDQQPPINTVIEAVRHREEEEEEEENEEELAVFGACEDGNVEENAFPTTVQTDEQQLENTSSFILYQDLALAAQIKHEEKKDFCVDTAVVFHAEFARQIAMPISLSHKEIFYYLLPEDECDVDPCQWDQFAYIKLDNAKAQFKCPNPHCARLWTSMRARVSFKISYPNAQGFVAVKVYGQNCQSCETLAEPLWYMEEVCRVMENLACSIYATLFAVPGEIEHSPESEVIDNSNQYYQVSYHDPQQRKGKMRRQHDKRHCQACQYGLCFV